MNYGRVLTSPGPLRRRVDFVVDSTGAVYVLGLHTIPPKPHGTTRVTITAWVRPWHYRRMARAIRKEQAT